MTESTQTPQQALTDIVGDAIQSRTTGRWQYITSNSWGGIDYRRHDGSTFRVTPIDGDWEAGAELYELTANGVLQRSLTYQGNVAVDEGRLAAIAAAFTS